VTSVPYKAVHRLPNREESISMRKSILVLEESRMVHELFESALQDDHIDWEVSHESSPDRYVQKAMETSPDIIFLSNQDQQRDYDTVRQIKSSGELGKIPLLLLTSAKDKLDETFLKSIGIRGFVRKPFETLTLQKQIETVLKEQERSKTSSGKDNLKDIKVVDDELLELMTGKSEPEVSVSDLEEELDPTFQLIPDESIDDMELEETELMAMDDSEELSQDDFIDDSDYAEDLDLDEEDDFDHDDSDFSDGELELDDVDEYSDFIALEDDEPEDYDFNEEEIQKIEIVEAPSPAFNNQLRNVPEASEDLGFMELNVVPLRTKEIQSSVVESMPEDFDEEKFVEEHIPGELEQEFMSLDSDPDYDEAMLSDSDEIVIPHEEIVEDFYEGEEDFEDELEDPDLLELSIEGLDDNSLDSPMDPFTPMDDEEESSNEGEVIFEELDDNEGMEETLIQEIEIIAPEIEEDDLSVVEQDRFEDENTDEAVIEQEGIVDIDIDFQDSPADDDSDEALEEEEEDLFDRFEEEDIDEESPSESELEKRRTDQLDIDLEEIAAAGSEEASATIQEMIGFRQVMKAKYELPGSEVDQEEEPDEMFDDMDEDLIDLMDDETSDDSLEAVEETDDFLEVPEDELDATDEDPDALEEIDLLNDLDEDDDGSDILEIEEDDDEEDSFDDVELLADEEVDDEGDDLMFEEPDEDGEDLMFDDPEETGQENMDSTADEDEDIFQKTRELAEDDDFAIEEEEDLPMAETGLEESEDETEEPFEEIELLIEDETDLDRESEELLQVDDETNEDVEAISFEEEDNEIESDDIDFLPVDEEPEPDSFSMENEIDNEPLDEDNDIDDIDFLPVDDDEVMGAEDEIEEIPIIDSEDSSYSPDLSGQEDPFDNIAAIDDADEITIEVPQETFEMGDFNVQDITDDSDAAQPVDPPAPVEQDDDLDLMNGIETVKVEEEDGLEENDSESFEDLEIPSMDEDLPDLPPILDVDEKLELGEETQNDIQLLQQEDDFEDFSENSDPISVPEKSQSTAQSGVSADLVGDELQKNLASISLSPEFKRKLSSMIEGVVSETVHNTLQEKLPEMVDKLMKEEIED
jgi:DNA-binding response OmpR family regulator